MKKIKIAFILSGLGHVNRGAETTFTEIIKRLAQKLDITVFGGGNNFHVNGVKYIKVPIIKRKYFEKFPNIKRAHLTHSHDWESVVFSIMLIPMFLRYEFDIISTHSAVFELLPSKIYRKFRKNTKIVFTSGGGTAFTHSRFFEADKVIAQNPEYYKLFSKKFSTAFIPCGVDIDVFKLQKVSRKEFNLSEDKFIIFSSSAFDPIKRLDFLIKAASKIKNAYLVFSSTGIQEKYLKKLGKQLMGDNIRFIGVVDKDELVKYYSLADVFCLPSKTEPFGMSLIDAMACHVPVVTNNTETQKWIVKDGGSCVNVNGMNVLIEALEKYKDKKLAEETGIKGRKNVVERFSYDIAAKKYYEVFKELVNR